MLIPYLFYGQWLLGEFACKLYYCIESINKLLSVHILTALAIERYCVVRQSVAHTCRLNGRIVSSIYLLIAALFVLSLLPFLSRVQVEIIPMPQNVTTFCFLLPNMSMTKHIVDQIPFFPILQMFSVICPYINCSGNWVFYVLLNKRLRRQIFRRSSSHATCERMLNRN
ncbi:hypothetical protein WR25_13444 [Diploscapter pachys]|uniref:G-protein coupled receptors family 1 profile domain-containing protein n=1 Tax=Diploscapter pachys TaxID=2018661 RepID=A0A2A2KGB9_9BILA|nr:hypothetical protein WR25_13444 [Diploscapter pachys]